MSWSPSELWTNSALTHSHSDVPVAGAALVGAVFCRSDISPSKSSSSPLLTFAYSVFCGLFYWYISSPAPLQLTYLFIFYPPLQLSLLLLLPPADIIIRLCLSLFVVKSVPFKQCAAWMLTISSAQQCVLFQIAIFKSQKNAIVIVICIVNGVLTSWNKWKCKQMYSALININLGQEETHIVVWVSYDAKQSKWPPHAR